MIADGGEIKARPLHWREHASPEIENVARGAPKQLSEPMGKDTGYVADMAPAKNAVMDVIEEGGPILWSGRGLESPARDVADVTTQNSLRSWLWLPHDAWLSPNPTTLGVSTSHPAAFMIVFVYVGAWLASTGTRWRASQRG